MALGKALSCIGAVTVCCVLLKVSSIMLEYVRPSRLSKYLREDTVAYALITGATDGIGLGFARELCRQGFGVILHGRNQQKLQRTQDALKDEFPDAQIRTFICDAALPTPPEVFDELVRDLVDVKLTILINNVGGSAGAAENPFKSYEECTSDQLDRVLNVNARFMTQLTRALLPQLRQNGPSMILNICSFSAPGIPFVTAYSATKGYIKGFSAALSMELKMQKKNVDVVTLIVGEVHTASYRMPPSFFVPTGREFARSALKNVGYGSGTITGYWPHAIQHAFVSAIPEWMRQRFVMQAVGAKMAAYTKHVKDS
ncbi:predicted protein [Uncinocarpus reesii 1704]|uniref:Short chain dehydrogenase/reductase n=1 Tax=Uncinocarpus reesii (strain UAMH 1704) TaxID=336963 RepID=C4JW15_UNCRE|nr:uncharacterized protein UREG_06757 [Uncinocarpus reesii 1704]EEP81892.1 predicted protein [Uncinocarpus reesii 1704]